MKYKRIGHQKTYKPFEFVYEKIELTEDFPIDKPDEECIKELASRIEAMARVIYPHLYDEKPTYNISALIKGLDNPYDNSGSLAQFIPPKEEPEPEQKPLLQLIQESKTLRELEGWKLLINVEKDEKKKKELKDAYNHQFKELQNQPA